MSLRPRVLPAGFVAPCLPTNAPQPPSGELWLHEIKHDGFRVIARKNGHRVKLYSRPGNDLTYRFPLIVEALAKLRSRSCIIDGEAVACSEDGIACFDHIRYRRHDGRVFLYAFDLIELDGEDMRRNGQSAAADAEGKASVARERVERIKRGENVEGGLGKPLTWEDCERIFRECGLTKSDMEHCRQVGQVSDVFGFETMLKAIHEARERAERNTVRKLQSRPLQHQRPWSRQTV